MIRRKNYFIKKRFQLSFSARFVFLLIVESLLIAALFMHASNNTLTTGYSGAILKVERTPDFFFVSFMLITLISVIGVAIAGMLIFILLSHRIAGPLYRFEKVLRDVAGGNLAARIDLRKTDQITELKESLNLLIGSMDKRMARIKNYLAQLEKLIPKRDDPENASKIDELLISLKAEIEYFKVTSGHKE